MSRRGRAKLGPNASKTRGYARTQHWACGEIFKATTTLAREFIPDKDRFLHAAANGDEQWRAVLHRFGEITTELTERFDGTVVKSTGDGHLATFASE